MEKQKNRVGSPRPRTPTVKNRCQSVNINFRLAYITQHGILKGSKAMKESIETWNSLPKGTTRSIRDKATGHLNAREGKIKGSLTLKHLEMPTASTLRGYQSRINCFRALVLRFNLLWNLRMASRAKNRKSLIPMVCSRSALRICIRRWMLTRRRRQSSTFQTWISANPSFQGPCRLQTLSSRS